MAEDIRVGSKLRMNLTFTDIASDGTTTPIDLTGISGEAVTVWKPNGSELDPAPALQPGGDPTAGEAYIEFAEDVLDAPGTWKAQGKADGYKSAVVSWKVTRNPP